MNNIWKKIVKQNNIMKIGTDINMDTNIKQGYLIMEFKKKELYPDGIFNPSCECRFYAHYPDYIKEEMGLGVGQKQLIVDVLYSAEELWDYYLEHKEGVDSMIDDSISFPKDHYSMLHLASDINSYCGL